MGRKESKHGSQRRVVEAGLPELAAVGATAGCAMGAALALWRLAAEKRHQAEEMQGKVALITGGSRGLGLALAHACADAGMRLVICARDARELEWAQRELEGKGADVLAVRCDVTDQEQVVRMVEAAAARFGHIDLLMNVAGVIIVGPLACQTLADFEEAMNTMFWGVVYTTLAALPLMRRRGVGRIVNVSSLGGKVSVPHLLPYSCAKFAMTGFSEGLRAELAGTGITVTTVTPGLLRTGSYLNALFKGNTREEYTWFTLADNLPILTMSARRAARQILTAARRGRAELALTLVASLAKRGAGVFPGMVSNLLGVSNRLLPQAEGGTLERVPGHACQTALTRSALTWLGQRAAQQYHQTLEGEALEGKDTAILASFAMKREDRAET